ncbi:MAG: hypothetical protein OXG10_02905 [Candidatus Dadabacteria bacterium]|nr:hypothetical protein [Candidatus Dadabacteria bacterium]
MELLLLILFVLVGFFAGTYILGTFFSLVFMQLPEVFRSRASGSSEVPVQRLAHLILETIGWFLLLLSLIFLVNKYLADYQKLFLCGIYVALAFHIGTLLNLYGRPS